MVWGVVDAGMAVVLKVTGPKLLGMPFNAIPETGTPLIVMVTVPVIIGKPFKRPLRLIEAVPNAIDCEAVRAANVGVILFTLSVKFCVASVPTPLFAVMVIGYVPTVPNAGVPLSTPAEVKVTPLGSAPVSVKLGAGKPVALTVNDPTVFTVNVALLALVIAGG